MVFQISLARGKHHAAVDVFESVPADAREVVVAQWQDCVSTITNTCLSGFIEFFTHRKYHMKCPIVFKSIYA